MILADRQLIAAELVRESDYRLLQAKSSLAPDTQKARALELRALARKILAEEPLS